MMECVSLFQVLLMNKQVHWRFRNSQTLAVVFRNALAQILGLQVTEIGYEVSQSGLGDLNNVGCIYLYDNAKGGAGFSLQFEDYLPEILQIAFDTLSNCDCSGACEKCLVSFDTQHDYGFLDRHRALEVLNQNVLDMFDLPSKIIENYGHGSTENVRRLLRSNVFDEVTKTLIRHRVTKSVCLRMVKIRTIGVFQLETT